MTRKRGKKKKPGPPPKLPSALVAARIRIARAEDAQDVFAEKIGVNVKILRAYEKRDREVPPEVLARVARVTGMDLEWLSGRRGTPPPGIAAEARPPHGRRGARGKLTPEVTEAVCAAIRGGCFAVVAARKAGISEFTFWNWRKRGDEARAKLDLGKDLSADEEEYLAFRDALDAADADAESGAALQLVKHGAVSPNATVELLQRRWPERWSVKQKVEHSGEVKTGSAAPIPLKGLSDDKLNQLEALLEEAMRTGKEPDAAAIAVATTPPPPAPPAETPAPSTPAEG